MAAACVLARRSGLNAVTVRAVAGAVGIGMGTLRHYFPSQDALHVAVLDRLVCDTVDDSSLRDHDLAPAERLSTCLRQLLPDERRDHEMWFARHHAGIGPEATETSRQHLAATTRRTREQVTAWLEQLVADGARLRPRERVSRFRTAREPLSIEEAALMLTALISGLRLEILTPDSGTKVAEACDLLAHVVDDLVS